MNRNSFIYLEVAAFILFLGLGYWAGMKFPSGEPARVHTSNIKPSANPITALPDGERILLIASVDKLERSEPQLRSLWLLTYYPNDLPIQLLPIYPANTTDHHPIQSRIVETFAIVKENGITKLSPGFLSQLDEYDFWLSGYILIDDQAGSTFINLIGGLPTDNGIKSGEQIISMLPGLDAPDDAYDQQALLLSQLCITFSQLQTPPQWDQILRLIPDHIISDIHPDRLLTEIQTLTSNHTQVRCEFPASTHSP